MLVLLLTVAAALSGTTVLGAATTPAAAEGATWSSRDSITVANETQHRLSYVVGSGKVTDTGRALSGQWLSSIQQVPYFAHSETYDYSTYSWQQMHHEWQYDIGQTGYRLFLWTWNRGNDFGSGDAYCRILDPAGRYVFSTYQADGVTATSAFGMSCVATQSGGYLDRRVEFHLQPAQGTTLELDADTPEGAALAAWMNEQCPVAGVRPQEQPTLPPGCEVKNAEATSGSQSVQTGPTVANCYRDGGLNPGGNSLTYNYNWTNTWGHSWNFHASSTVEVGQGAQFDFLFFKLGLQVNLAHTLSYNGSWSESTSVSGSKSLTAVHGATTSQYVTRNYTGYVADAVFKNDGRTWRLNRMAIAVSSPEDQDLPSPVDTRTPQPGLCPVQPSTLRWSVEPDSSALGQPTTMAVLVDAGPDVLDGYVARNPMKGTVTFRQGDRDLCEVSLTQGAGPRLVSCSTRLDPRHVGANAVTVRYSGDAAWSRGYLRKNLGFVAPSPVAVGNAQFAALNPYQLPVEVATGAEADRITTLAQRRCGAGCGWLDADTEYVARDFKAMPVPVPGQNNTFAPMSWVRNCNITEASSPFSTSFSTSTAATNGFHETLTNETVAKVGSVHVALVTSAGWGYTDTQSLGNGKAITMHVGPMAEGRVEQGRTFEVKRGALYYTDPRTRKFFVVEDATVEREVAPTLRLNARRVPMSICAAETTTTSVSVPDIVTPYKPTPVTATVMAGSRPARGGTVDILDGRQMVCRDVPVVDGRATCPAVLSVTGSRTLLADYNGFRDDNSWVAGSPNTIGGLRPSSGTATTFVGYQPTSTVLTTSVYAGTPTVKVKVSNGSDKPPTGPVSIQLYGGGGGGTCETTIAADGTASCRQPIPGAGSISVGVRYGGDAANKAFDKAEVINAAFATKLSLTAARATTPAQVGQSVTYTAVVKPDAPYGSDQALPPAWMAPPYGGVMFKADGQAVCYAQLVPATGTATCTETLRTSGSRTITADYHGTTDYAGSSDLTRFDVGTPTTITMHGVGGGEWNDAPRFTAYVDNPTTSPATGTVDFVREDGQLLCSGSLAGNPPLTRASCQASSPAGTHRVTARYKGGDGFLPSVSPVVQLDVQVVAAVGGGRTCAAVGGSDWGCWGDAAQSAVAPPSAAATTSLSDSGTYGCGRKGGDSYAAVCWGDGPAPPAGVYIATDVAKGAARYGCGIASPTFGVTCWGSGAYDMTSAAPAGSGYYSLSMGTDAGCALQFDGTPKCWVAPTVSGDRDAVTYNLKFLAEKYQQISVASARRVCGITLAGDALCTVPVGAGAPPKLKQISVSSTGACGVLAADSSLWCAGATPPSIASATPAGTFSSVQLGSGHACAVRLGGARAGTLACWGASPQGQTTVPARFQ